MESIRGTGTSSHDFDQLASDSAVARRLRFDHQVNRTLGPVRWRAGALGHHPREGPKQHLLLAPLLEARDIRQLQLIEILAAHENQTTPIESALTNQDAVAEMIRTGQQVLERRIVRPTAADELSVGVGL